MKSIVFLDFEEIVRLHNHLITKYGGAIGVRDKRLLESAAVQPQMKMFGKFIHPDLYLMAAAYCFHIIKNHPFVDGNKRTGILAALTFLSDNEIIIQADFDSLYTMAIKVACSELDKDQIAEFFRQAESK